MTRVQFCPVCGKKSELLQGQTAFGVLWETVKCQNKECGATTSIVRTPSSEDKK